MIVCNIRVIWAKENQHNLKTRDHKICIIGVYYYVRVFYIFCMSVGI